MRAQRIRITAAATSDDAKHFWFCGMSGVEFLVLKEELDPLSGVTHYYVERNVVRVNDPLQGWSVSSLFCEPII